MIMNYFWCLCTILCAAAALLGGRDITQSLMDGAGSAVEISVCIAGPLCLWNGLGALMERLGLSGALAKLFRPMLKRLYPSTQKDPALAGAVTANFCANLLGLGNAATPMGIQAVRRLRDPDRPEQASDEMCRLVVMNTASIQLLPTTVAAVRAAAGCGSPFDILPCVWISSLLSVCAGLCAAGLFGKLWHHG